MNFLKDQPSQGPWTLDPNKHKSNLKPGNYWLGKYGKGNVALEVIHATFNRQPPRNDVRNAWKNHWNDRPAPVLLIASYTADGQQLASVCGPTEQKKLTVWERVPFKRAEQLAKVALNATDRDNAINLIRDALPELNSPLPGVINRGLFSTHHLVNRATKHDDYDDAVQEARQLYGRKDKDLVQGLGYAVEELPIGRASILRDKNGGQVKQAVAVFLKENEFPELTSDRFNRNSPVTYALTMADREQLPYAVVTKGSQIRLYCTDVTKGVGRKGRTETYVELNTDLLGDQSAGLLPLLFAPRALKPDGTVGKFLQESHQFASAIGERLRDRIYEDAVPLLATSLARQQSGNSNPTPEQLESYYEQAMLVLFRILFVAYAEDRDLLPFRTNGDYQDHSLKHKAKRLSARSADAEYAPNQSTLWQEVNDLWQAVAKGNVEWGVPPYNGGLFDDDPTTRPAGAALSCLSLTNADFGPVLEALLVDKAEHGPVDFRSLSVREFGTIYEGLLESSLGYAETDLTLMDDKKRKQKDIYIPASNGQNVVVQTGEFYLHNRSGQRKSSGSYFTKSFAVEHLLKEGLAPALKNHLDRIAKLLDDRDEASAAENFFDFRCADISMGSGHFLIAAIDYIEREMANFLNENPIRGVQTELDCLRNAAHHNLQQSLGISAQDIRIENSNLLRRQIARRCIYGVDINSISVELARLSVWIYTFVQGLPLSFLDRTLVHGDSLTGIGTIEELLDVFQLDPQDMMATHIKGSLEAATEPLKRLAKISEVNIAEAQRVRDEYQSAVAETILVKDTMDLAIGIRVSIADRPVLVDLKEAQTAKGFNQAKQLAEELNAVHFPVAFPEVFMSDRPGFDCIIGNPPWEEIKFEARDFWTLRILGLRSLNQAKQKEAIADISKSRPDLVAELQLTKARIGNYSVALESGPYDTSTGDTDLYKIFAWRFWYLLADDGYIGVVLPRSALSAKGMTRWRQEIIENGTIPDATLLLNRSNWAFDDMEARYTISLTTIRKTSSPQKMVSTRGPYSSPIDYETGILNPRPQFSVAQFKQWNEDMAFPMIPTAEAVSVYSKMMAHPKLNNNKHPWSAKPIAELHATKDKPLMIFGPKVNTGLWPVYGGRSFNLWQPDTGEHYAWIEPDTARNHLFPKRNSQAHTRSSAFYGQDSNWLDDPTTLPIEKPRIAFRNITRSTDSRTVITSLVPPSVGIANHAPYLFTNEDIPTEAFLLGIMSSIPFDWVARRIVEINLNFFIFNSLPIPLPPSNSPHKAELQTLAARLAAVDDRYADWAKQAGVTVGSVKSEDEKQDIIHRIDALVAHLYGLDETDLQTIFETFHKGWDYKPRLNAVLEHFRKL